MMLRGLVVMSLIAASPLVSAGQVPPTAAPTRIGPTSGVLEIRHVRRDGTLAAWTPLSIQGVDFGWVPPSIPGIPCPDPSSGAVDPTTILLSSDWRAALAHVRDLGANTIRLYHFFPAGHPLALDAARFLDLCYDLGVHVIFTVLWDPAAPPFAANGYLTTQTNLLAAVASWRHHPAVLAWSLQNEFTLAAPSTIAVAAPQVNAVANAVKSVDPDRIVFSGVHDDAGGSLFQPFAAGGQTLPLAQWCVSAAPDIDLWMINGVRGFTMQSLLSRWPDTTNGKPFVISEYGAHGYNPLLGGLDVALHDAEFARMADELHRASVGPSPVSGFSGSLVFSLAHEYWKAGQPCTQDPSSFPTLGIAATPAFPYTVRWYGDAVGARYEEWFGLVSHVVGRLPAFATVADIYRRRTGPMSGRSLHATSMGFVAGGGLAEGFFQLRINGNTVLLSGRGLTLVTLDEASGAMSSWRTFDTWGNPADVSAATTTLNTLPPGKLVACGVGDTLFPFGAANAAQIALINALKGRLGALAGQTTIPFRHAWAAIGRVGASAPIAEAGPTNVNASSPPLPVTAAVPFLAYDLDGDGMGDDVDPDSDGDGVLDADELQAGTDPVDPSPQPWSLRLGVDGLGRLTVDLLPGHPSAVLSTAQLEFSTFELRMVDPVSADLTPLLATAFVPGTAPIPGGLRIVSVPSIPAGLGLAFAARMLTASGPVLRDAVAVP